MISLTLFAQLIGCASYETVDEACNDDVPNGDLITDPDDFAVAQRKNCHRRIVGVPEARVLPGLQEATEAHAAYLEANPSFLNPFYELNGREGWTGDSVFDRIEAAGRPLLSGEGLLQVIVAECGVEPAAALSGADVFDLWFAEPTFRPAFIQNPQSGFGVARGNMMTSCSVGGEPIPVAFTYWNIIYQIPTTPYAQGPTRYPRNGQTDVPASWANVSFEGYTGLEFGQVYGYPLTYTVGVGEVGLEVPSATLVGPDGPESITVILGEGATTAGQLSNTAIIVPNRPLAVGQEYSAVVEISTDQGSRRSKTDFMIGSRVVPDPFDNSGARRIRGPRPGMFGMVDFATRE